MRSVKKILWSCAVLAVVCGCTKLETPPNKNQPSGDGTGVYKVVAHRGGYQECARPDCSISSLKYAIMLRCFASECDIVLTGDNDVLVAHPQSGYLVNGWNRSTIRWPRSVRPERSPTANRSRRCAISSACCRTPN